MNTLITEYKLIIFYNYMEKCFDERIVFIYNWDYKILHIQKITYN